MSEPVQFSVFTKPWRSLEPVRLAQMVRGWGFDGIEFPLRPGYQVEPSRAEQDLPKLARTLQAEGVSIFSVASSLDEQVFAACADADVPLIRIMVPIAREQGYLASEVEAVKRLEIALVHAERYQVSIGVQQHYGDCVPNAFGLVRIVERLHHPLLKSVWDAAHDALAGIEPEYGLELVRSSLGMVNLKNAYYVRTNGPEAEGAEWTRYFTTGPHGLASWTRVAKTLARFQYQGVVCLTAEYDAASAVDVLVAQDICYARDTFRRAYAGEAAGRDPDDTP